MVVLHLNNLVVSDGQVGAMPRLIKGNYLSYARHGFNVKLTSLFPLAVLLYYDLNLSYDLPLR